MYLKIKTSPKWLGENLLKVFGTIAALWSFIVFLSGWFGGVNATVKDFPTAITRLGIIERQNEEYKGRFNTFIDMYKLEVLGRSEEARELAKKLDRRTNTGP